MNAFLIFEDILIILIVSLPIIYLFKKINLPSIVGFLIAGIIIGPYGFKLIKSNHEIEAMAEIGVALLLFTIGLEVSYSRLMKIKKYLITTGGFQVGLTLLISWLLFYTLGLSAKQSIFSSMLITLSSTAVVLKLLSDRKELETPQGRLSVGILVFQDLMIVPMFLVLPIISADSNIGLQSLFMQIFFSFGALALLIFLARFLMPKILFQIAALRLNEAFTIGIILLLLGSAYITHSLGLSFALGAFIAGLILAESDYNMHILSDITPLKDAFNTIFFVSIGLLLDLQFIFENPIMVFSTAISIVLLKCFIIVIILLLVKYPLRIALLTGVGLSQIGEFSFILAKAGLNFNLIENDLYKVFLASTIFTMILTPFLIRMTHYFISLNDDIIVKENKGSQDSISLEDHVIIAGYGLNGKSVSKVLRETGIKYVVVELNPYTVKSEKINKENIIFGDISKQEILKKAHIDKAQVLVFAISDPNTTKRGLKIAKKLKKDLFTVVRTRYINEIDDLKRIGADVVVPEEFETSLEIFKRVLQHYHIPMNIIMKQTGLLRGETYKLLREENKNNIDDFVHLDEILAQGLTEIYYINEDNEFIGKEIREIDLRKKTNATIIAIVREGRTIANPSGIEKLNSKDTLVITGDHASVDRAISFLDNNTTEN